MLKARSERTISAILATVKHNNYKKMLGGGMKIWSAGVKTWRKVFIGHQSSLSILILPPPSSWHVLHNRNFPVNYDLVTTVK